MPHAMEGFGCIISDDDKHIIIFMKKQITRING